MKKTYTYESSLCPICGSRSIILFLNGGFIMYQCSNEDCEYKFKNDIQE